MMRPLRYLTILVLLLARSAAATHNEAGEILVCHVGGLEYEVTIVTHTNPFSPADRPEFILEWGDGTTDTIPRDSQITITVGSEQVFQNLYIATHIYQAPGVFTLQYIDPNRIAGVLNFTNGNSVDIPMCVQSQIIVTPDLTDCLPVFLNLPIQEACIYQPWIHNPAAYDADGDSLSFHPVLCLGPDIDDPPDGWGDPVPDYVYPNEVSPAPDTYAIDPVTGTISWISPQIAGFYNIAFIVREWRDGVMIGWVMRDMLVIVDPNCDNEIPVFGAMTDTCVVAGTNVNFQVQATDPDLGQVIEIDAFGGPLVIQESPAIFTTNPGTSPVSGTFNWNTTCAHVRQQPWQVVFNVHDNGNPQLNNFGTATVRVVAPEPLNPTATPQGDIMRLQWDPDVCTNAVGYRIYRRQELFGFNPDHCETGVPGYTGYALLDTIGGWANTTYDDQGLIVGINYCYMVTAFFADGGESLASDEFCNMLERDVPILTNVTVMTTDLATGGDSVVWSNAWDLDTNQYPGPYFFKVYEGSGFTTTTTLIHTTGASVFLEHPDTAFLHLNINTADIAHVYRVELYHGTGDGQLVGSGNTASSVLLGLDPNDEQITLTAAHNTPWINTLYEVFRETSPGVFTLIGSSGTSTYVDSGLVNGERYCYYVRTTGAYSDPDITAPLINNSQIVCGRPIDLTPPCAPTLVLDNDCETPLNTLTWNNPNETCADDTERYNIWFTDSLGGTPVLISTLVGAELTTFLHTDGLSVAGCYAITAIDDMGNESLLSDTVCGDNCPVYELPNVFTPNNDERNDLFLPFPYRGVKEIDLHIFNRWGMLVFSSQDPAIQWPGTYKATSEQVPDGVYYYTCNVVMKRLSGSEVKQLKGYVHILRGKQTTLN
jgi:gliding motility-associated-like protein